VYQTGPEIYSPSRNFDQTIVDRPWTQANAGSRNTIRPPGLSSDTLMGKPKAVYRDGPHGMTNFDIDEEGLSPG